MPIVLVVPRPATLNAMTFNRLVAADGGASARSLVPQGSLLEERLAALQRFALGIYHPGVLGLGAPGADEAPRFRALPAVGALVMEEDTIDREALESSGEALVLDNVDIPLVDAIDAGSVAEPDFWHLDRIDVAAARRKGLTGRGVLVGGVDTGIDASHPEFAGRHIEFQEFDGHGRALSKGPRDVLRSLKAPLLERLAGFQGVEVQDLPTLPQAIVRADAARWREMSTPGGILYSDPQVRVLPNVRFHATSGR